MTNESKGLVGAIKKDLPAFAIFLLAGVLLALGIRAALNPEETSASHDHAAMQDMEDMEKQPVASAPSSAVAGPVIDLGNEICPIMKKPVDGRTYSVWEGLRVGHCCRPCVKDLLADPARLLDEAGIEWRPAAEAINRYRDAAPAAKAAVLEEIAGQFTLVGED